MVVPEIGNKSEYVTYPEEWRPARPTQTRRRQGRAVVSGRVEKSRLGLKQRAKLFLASVRAKERYSLRDLPERRLSRHEEVMFERLAKLQAAMRWNAEISMNPFSFCFH